MKKLFLMVFMFLNVINSSINATDHIIGLESLVVTKAPHLKPDGESNIEVFVVETEHQDSGEVTGHRFNAEFLDHTCLHRAFNGAAYIIQALMDGSRGSDLNRKLMEDMGKPFFDVLHFDAFVNPALYSSLCADFRTSNNIWSNVAQKIVYFHSDSRHAPVAGTYSTSSISVDTFKVVQDTIINTMKQKELYPSLEESLDFNDATLCFNSDYKEFLYHLRAMHNVANYYFACVTTKVAGQCGHGVTIIINKVDGDIQFLCLDGANIGVWGDYYKRCVDVIARMVTDYEYLERAIIRYISAMNPVNQVISDVKTLNLSRNDLYVSHYKPGVIARLYNYVTA
jgi:hypothetical protein